MTYMNRIKMHRSKLFLLCLFLLGLLTVFQYGAHLDQKSEQEIMYSNIKMYLRCFGGAVSSLYRCLDAGGITDIAYSVERDHGVAVYYPVFWIFFIDQVSPFIGNIIWHVYIYFIVFCGILALYGLLREMFCNSEISAMVTSMFFFTPRMFAESHYNNKDMVLLSLTLCIFYCGWKLWRKMSWRYLIGFSLAGSLAANMKIIGIFIWGIIGLYIFCAMLYNHQMNGEVLKKALACIIITTVLYIFVSPACWTGLGEFIQYLFESANNFRWNDYILFAGNMYNKNITGMPRTYLPVMILLSVPTGILLVALIGFGYILFLMIRKPSRFFETAGYTCTAILSGMIPLCYAVLTRTPVYNGWRHFYFCYGAILIMAAYGIFFCINMIRMHSRLRWVRPVLWGYVLLLAGGILINHPYEYGYYNFLAGRQIENTYELDYWDMSFKQAYEVILNDIPEGNVTVGTISNPSLWGLEAQLYAIRGKNRMRITLCSDWRDAEYLIINPMYAYMYGSGDYAWVKENYRQVDTLTSYGNVICEIYRR